MSEVGRKKRQSVLSLGDKYLTILDEICKLKREADKANGYHVARGSREEYVRYSRTKAASLRFHQLFLAGSLKISISTIYIVARIQLLYKVI